MFSQYKFQNFHRLSLFWDSPNECAAFLVCVLPLALAVQLKYSRRHADCFYYVSLLSEVLICLLLALTYSRGGLISVFVVYFTLFLYETRIADTSSQKRRAIYGLLARLALVTLLVSTTGLIQRVSPNFVSNDHSVLNRIAVWRGSAYLIGSEPLFGWGGGLSGFFYMNLIQPETTHLFYGGLVNSFVDIFVCYGAVVGWVSLTLSLFFSSIGVLIKNSNLAWVNATASLVVAGWVTSNLFSSLFFRLNLWFLPAMACLFLCVNLLHAKPEVFKIAWKTALAALSLTLFILIYSLLAASTIPLKFQCLKRGIVRISAKHSQHPIPISLLIVPSLDVAGRYPGKVARTLIYSEAFDEVSIAFSKLTQGLVNSLSNETIVVMGSRACEISNVDFRSHSLILLDPQMPVSLPKAAISTISFPYVDKFGTEWLEGRWCDGKANKNNFKIVNSGPGSWSQNLESAFIDHEHISNK